MHEPVAPVVFWPTMGTLVIRGALGAIFASAVIAKVVDRRRFANAVRAYGLVPDRLAATAALAVVLAEAFVAIGMITGIALAISLALASAMLIAFALAMAFNLTRGRRFDCGCGVPLPKEMR